MNKELLIFISIVALLAAFAAWLVTFGIKQKKQNAHLRKACIEAVAGVVKGYHTTGEAYIDDDGERHDSTRAFPIFEYTIDGRAYTLQSGVYDTFEKRRYKIGQPINVFHAPGDPKKIYIPEKDNATNARLCIGFGGALPAFCAFAAVRFISQR
jgi:Protein of unknown function (DUF3592).